MDSKSWEIFLSETITEAEEDVEKCPKCGYPLEKGYTKVNDSGGYDFQLGVEYDCKNCGYNHIDV